MTLNIGKGILIEAYGTYELADMYLSVKDIGVFANLLVELVLILVALIGNLTYDLLKDILKRDKSLRRSLLINNDGDVNLLLLELL